MSGCTHTAGSRWHVLRAASLLALALPGCLTDSRTPVVKEAARPHADQIRAEAPNLLPEQPVTSTTSSRGQQGEVVPASGAGADYSG